jgi:hypothetical protein
VTGSEDNTMRLWDLRAKYSAANPVVLHRREGTFISPDQSGYEENHKNIAHIAIGRNRIPTPSRFPGFDRDREAALDEPPL